jgi:hypothetical protein
MSKSYRNLIFIIFTVLAVILFIYFLPEITQIEWRGKNEGWSAVIRNFALILGGTFGFWFAWKRITLAERGQITDRYSKAIEQLGDRENVSVCIGGLYALQRIAKDSKDDLPTIIDVIRAFLIHPPYQKEWREWEKWAQEPPKDRPKLYIPCPDIKIAISLFKELTPYNRPSLQYANWHALDLINTDLSNLDLQDANMSDARLLKSNFRNTNLYQAAFRNSDLRATNFQTANLQHIKTSNITLFLFNNISAANLTDTGFLRLNIPNSRNFWHWEGIPPTVDHPSKYNFRKFPIKLKEEYETSGKTGFPTHYS